MKNKIKDKEKPLSKWKEALTTLNIHLEA